MGGLRFSDPTSIAEIGRTGHPCPGFAGAKRRGHWGGPALHTGTPETFC